MLMDIKAVIRGFTGYAASLGLAVVFALFLSGRVGWFLILVMLLAPVLSPAITLFFVKSMRVEGSAETGIINKGDTVRMKISITNGFFVPSPPVVFKMTDNPYMQCGEKNIYVSVIPFFKENFEISWHAKICGKSEIGVSSVRVTDYLGLFSFKLKNVDLGTLRGSVCVIPDVPDIPVNSAVISKINEVSADADDSEDTTESTGFVRGGFPGYDSREYVPGDPLKRINWKLSAKRSKLLVRLDDEVPGLTVSVVLDSSFVKDSVTEEELRAVFGKTADKDELAPLAAQRSIEMSLGITRALVLSGYTVSYFYRGETDWEIYNVASEGDMVSLRIAMAGFAFADTDGTERFPYYKMAEQKGSVSVFCTPFIGDDSIGGTQALLGGKNNMNTLVYSVVNKGGDRLEG